MENTLQLRNRTFSQIIPRYPGIYLQAACDTSIARVTGCRVYPREGYRSVNPLLMPGATGLWWDTVLRRSTVRRMKHEKNKLKTGGAGGGGERSPLFDIACSHFLLLVGLTRLLSGVQSFN